MLIIGIDHALNGPCGIAVLDTDKEMPVVHAEVLRYAKGGTIDTRAALLYQTVYDLSRAADLRAIACEATYHGRNPHTTLILEHAAGMMRGIAIQRGARYVRVRHDETDAVKATLPASWLRLTDIPAAQRVHAIDAIAIAWHGAGLVRRDRMAA